MSMARPFWKVFGRAEMSVSFQATYERLGSQDDGVQRVLEVRSQSVDLGEVCG